MNIPAVWTINPDSTNPTAVLTITNNVYNASVTNNDYAFPVVYLDSSIRITGGNGQAGITNSYKLG